jgi:hypothetical protein
MPILFEKHVSTAREHEICSEQIAMTEDPEERSRLPPPTSMSVIGSRRLWPFQAVQGRVASMLSSKIRQAR